jgi:hypothetical protein
MMKFKQGSVNYYCHARRAALGIVNRTHRDFDHSFMSKLDGNSVHPT